MEIEDTSPSAQVLLCSRSTPGVHRSKLQGPNRIRLGSYVEGRSSQLIEYLLGVQETCKQISYYIVRSDSDKAEA